MSELSSSMNETVSDIFKGETVDELRQMFVYLYYGASAEDSLGYTLHELDAFYHNQLIIAIHSGVRITAAFIVSALLFLVARSYRSKLFCMYQINFALMLIGGTLELGWVFSFNGSISAYITNAVPLAGDINVGMAASVFQTLLMLSLLATLVMQVYVAFSDKRNPIQWGATGVAMLGCFPAYFVCIWRLADIGTRVFSSSNQGQNSYGAGFFSSSAMYGERGVKLWAYNGAWRSFAASCAFCSLILCIKLYLVQRNRAAIGIEKFDPIKILLTMAIQNSVIPSILAIISSGIPTGNSGGQSISASTIPICACMLPIGYIWAQYTMLTGTGPTQEEIMRSSRKKDLEMQDDYSDYMSTSPYADTPTTAASDYSSTKNNQ